MMWTKVTIDTSVEAVDLISAFLDEYGVEGIEISDNVPLTEGEKSEMYVDIPLQMENDGSAQISCYIDDRFQIDSLKADIAAELTRLEAFIPVGTKKIEISQTEDADWMNNWKQYFRPFRLYDNIVIKPTWETMEAVDEMLKQEQAGITGADCIVIEIDPGIAFGTGSHETTKLCIGQIKKYLKEGDTVFDVGCGSGILSIVSSKLGAGFVHGMDIDEVAVRTSVENAVQNHVDETRIQFSCGNLLEDNYIGKGTTFQLDASVIKSDQHMEADRQYDIVVANILADVIVPLCGVIRPYLKPEGYFITSGILKEKLEDVRTAMLAHDFEIVDVVTMNDWVSVIAKYS